LLCASRQVLSVLGPAMIILVKNDQSNLRKVRDAVAALPADEARDGSVRSLLLGELKSGIHKAGAVCLPSGDGAEGVVVAPRGGTLPTGCTGGATLRDPSAAMSLLWLKRSL